MKLAFVILVLLFAVNGAIAQRHFSVTVQSFDSKKQDWGDTTVKHFFWKNSQGVLDSIWTFEGVNSRVYRDWVKVTSHVDRFWFSRFPTDFVQYATKGYMPRRTEFYRDNGIEKSIQGYDSMAVIDSFVTD
jgi:hypothetical protein